MPVKPGTVLYNNDKEIVGGISSLLYWRVSKDLFTVEKKSRGNKGYRSLLQRNWIDFINQ
jgi:hypothetical protein